MEISQLMQEEEPYIIEQRRYFHRHPELSGQEMKTAAAIRAQLDEMGIPHKDLTPGYGVAGILHGAFPGKAIALRADIDALPIQEETGCAFTSENPKVMHACGHDAHAAMLLGAAKALSRLREQLHGTVYFLFQPAEETGGGADEILKFLDARGGVDQIIGLHIWGSVPSGEIVLLPGIVFAGGCAISFRVNGRGGHGARPDQTDDPLKAACDLLLQVTAIPSNYHSVLHRCVVSICTLHGGTRSNIVPDTAQMGGSIRYFKRDDLPSILEEIRRKVQGVEISHNVQVDFKVESRDSGVPPVCNTPACAARAAALVEQVEGLRCSPQPEPICAGDNMARLLERYPGFYGVLGAAPASGGCPQHSAVFQIDESALRKGSELMVRYACDCLR